MSECGQILLKTVAIPINSRYWKDSCLVACSASSNTQQCIAIGRTSPLRM